MERVNFDPLPKDRQWVRHAQTGDRGYLVLRGGEMVVRYDRGASEITVPYNTRDWDQEEAEPPVSELQVAMVCYEADIPLCRVLGLRGERPKSWLSMTDRERLVWKNEGPTNHPKRMQLWEAIRKVLLAEPD